MVRNEAAQAVRGTARAEVTGTVEWMEARVDELRRVPDVVQPCRRQKELDVVLSHGRSNVGSGGSDGAYMAPPGLAAHEPSGCPSRGSTVEGLVHGNTVGQVGRAEPDHASGARRRPHNRYMAQAPLRLRQSPDVPDVLLHMTWRYGKRPGALPPGVEAQTPAQRVGSILHMGGIFYGSTFDSASRVVCFAQTTRRALSALTANRFFPAGIAFRKQAVWDAGGGPVHYIRGDHWDEWRNAQLPDGIKALGVRLWPENLDAPDPTTFFRDGVRGPSEWMHEREWRIPQPVGAPWGWTFARDAVAFLIFEGPGQRDEMLATLRYWRGHDGWAASLPVAYHAPHHRTFEGVDDALWP